MSDLSPCPGLSVHTDGAVAVIRLSRPAKRNALNEAMVAGLRTLVSGFPSAIRAVVIHGEGDHFCAGLDLGEVDGEPDLAAGIHHSLGWHRAFQDIQFGRVPVISVLHGAVVGGGFELAAATHIRIAEHSAFFALPEGQRGIFLGGGGSVRIPRLIGTPLVQDMMLTGRSLSATEARAAGACQYLVEDGAGLALAVELAQKAAEIADMTRFAVIHALPRIAEADPSTGYLTEALMASVAQTMPEAKARVRDFLAKKAARVARPD
ncbi:MAG: unsaturated acyl-CoA hydratase [Xanthobacteraceae bacterium]|nr:MAG: unsaturated acyl-CoA hydratase [Xanthobacteraceae bacterium]